MGARRNRPWVGTQPPAGVYLTDGFAMPARLRLLTLHWAGEPGRARPPAVTAARPDPPAGRPHLLQCGRALVRVITA